MNQQSFVQAKPLDEYRLRQLAPSIFAEQPHESRSEQFQFFPTIKIVEALGKAGLFPAYAAQSCTRLADRRDFTKHIIRFRGENFWKYHQPGRHEFFKQGDPDTTFPEVILTNGHDGSSALKFEAGLLRMACWNGLVASVPGANSSYTIRHLGKSAIHDAVEASRAIIDSTSGKVLNRIEEFKHIELNPRDQEIFATGGAIVRWGTAEDGALRAPVPPAELLRTRRAQDRNQNNLWSTLNIVQENIMKGGLPGRNSSGRRQRTRAVNSVNEDMRVNRSLWELAEERFAKQQSTPRAVVA